MDIISVNNKNVMKPFHFLQSGYKRGVWWWAWTCRAPPLTTTAATTTATTMPMSVNFTSLRSYIFISFQQITFKVDNFTTDFKVFFPAVLKDFP